jgi:hypothetical protein
MSSSPITALRLQLRAAGFPPLPCEGKKPAPKAWPKLNADDTNIKRWPQTFPAAVNTGVLCATVPCLDIDVLHPEAADAVEAMVRARFAERGQVLTRFGRRPKRCCRKGSLVDRRRAPRAVARCRPAQSARA